MTTFRNKFRAARQSIEQFTADGRNLSDTSHPDYDPATDPELRKLLILMHPTKSSQMRDEVGKARKRVRESLKGSSNESRRLSASH